MGFFAAYAAFWKNYIHFGGRSSRSAFWWVQLWNFLISIIIFAIVIGPLIHAIITKNFAELGIAIIIVLSLYILYWLAVLIPSLSLAVRRFHDVNLSAWWYVGLCVLPLVLNDAVKFTIGTKNALYIVITFISLFAGIASFVITLLPSKDPNKFKPETNS
ncbi:MAG: DUF805 domain-containing protein [Sporolactobacillus sp.]